VSKKDLVHYTNLFAEAFLQTTEENLILRKKLENREKDARTDFLTGLGNLRYLTEEVERLKAMVSRKQIDVSYICLTTIDLDNLKTINDTHGHPAGDKAIQTVAAVLKTVIRSGDIVARTGGDEFIIISLFRTQPEVETFKERIELSLDKIVTDDFIVMVSVGSFCDKLDKEFNFEKAKKLSDAEMYQKKLQRKKTG